MVFTGPKLENQNDAAGCFYLEEPSPLGVWEQQFSCTDGFGLPPFFEYEPFPLAYPSSLTSNVELNDFDEIAGDLGLWDFEDQPMVPFNHNDFSVGNPNPVMNMHGNQNRDVCARMYESSMQNPTMNYQRELWNSSGNMSDLDVKRNARYKSSSLTLEEIQKYFDVPITRAAKELNVGLTVLKKRCRELNIARWPHRKIKSLKSLIHNVKELGLTGEIEMLEEHKRMVERIPEMELTERTKKLRQACFKANYKKRRSIQQHHFS